MGPFITSLWGIGKLLFFLGFSSEGYLGDQTAVNGMVSKDRTIDADGPR